MRPEKRIKEITKLIEEIWKLHPDYRLGQLLCNIVNRFETLTFNVEDDTLQRDLENYLKAYKSQE